MYNEDLEYSQAFSEDWIVRFNAESAILAGAWSRPLTHANYAVLDPRVLEDPWLDTVRLSMVILGHDSTDGRPSLTAEVSSHGQVRLSEWSGSAPDLVISMSVRALERFQGSSFQQVANAVPVTQSITVKGDLAGATDLLHRNADLISDSPYRIADWSRWTAE